MARSFSVFEPFKCCKIFSKTAAPKLKTCAQMVPRFCLQGPMNVVALAIFRGCRKSLSSFRGSQFFNNFFAIRRVNLLTSTTYPKSLQTWGACGRDVPNPQLCVFQEPSKNPASNKQDFNMTSRIRSCWAGFLKKIF